MKRVFFKFNLVGLLCMCAGTAFIVFNIPLYAWLIMLGALLVAVGIYMCR